MSAFIATILAGSLATFCVFLAVSRAIIREDRQVRVGKLMPSVPPSPTAALARRIVGYYARRPVPRCDTGRARGPMASRPV